MSNLMTLEHQERSLALEERKISILEKYADRLSKSKLIPDHLKGDPGACFAVASYAFRLGLDTFAVAQATSVVRGRLCLEGKLIHAALLSTGAIASPLTFTYEGQGNERTVLVTGTPRGGSPVSVEGSVGSWATDNGAWKKSPDQMLAYRGSREWARRYCPQAVLGLSTPDEVRTEVREAEGVVVHDEPNKSIRTRIVKAQEPVQDPVPKPVDSTPVVQAPLSEVSDEDMKKCANYAVNAGITKDAVLDALSQIAGCKITRPIDVPAVHRSAAIERLEQMAGL